MEAESAICRCRGADEPLLKEAAQSIECDEAGDEMVAFFGRVANTTVMREIDLRREAKQDRER